LGPRPGPGVQGPRPTARLRPLLPRRRRAPPARVGARARHRAPGGGGTRGTRRGGQRPARGRTARGLVRPAHALTPAEPEKRALWTNVRPSGAPLERHDRPTDRTPLG